MTNLFTAPAVAAKLIPIALKGSTKKQVDPLEHGSKIPHFRTEGNPAESMLAGFSPVSTALSTS